MNVITENNNEILVHFKCHLSDILATYKKADKVWIVNGHSYSNEDFLCNIRYMLGGNVDWIAAEKFALSIIGE